MQLTTISGKSPLAAAIRYAMTRMERLRPYLDNGILEWYPSGEGRGGSSLTVAIHCDHLDEVFDAEWGECEKLDVGGAVYPDDPVFGLHANGEVMEIIDALAEFLRDAIDGRDGMDLVQLHDQAA